MSGFLTRVGTHAGRLERWLGTEQIEEISRSMCHWYGPPIALAGVPGAVWACGGGDFRGPIGAGRFAGLADYGLERSRQAVAYSGFASLSALVMQGRRWSGSRMRFHKTISASSTPASTWLLGTLPPAGSAGAAAPGGTAFNSTSTGALPLINPPSGETQHFVGASVSRTAACALLLYDRLFAVAKTMNSTASESVTGVPTRYQSTTSTDQDYIGGNFGFTDVTTNYNLPPAHTWTTCLYQDQTGASSTLPASASGGSTVGLMDNPQWFMPLATGDTGIQAWTQLQCSSTVIGGLDFVIGHPIAFLPTIASGGGLLQVHQTIQSAFNLVRIFDDACLALISLASASGTASGLLETAGG